MAINQAYNWIAPALRTIKRANWDRCPIEIHARQSNLIEVGDRTLVMFASNNYLDLADHPQLIAAAIAATQAYGTGSTGSRLVSGHLALHDQLEQGISQWKNTEAALVFSSGYLANLGVVAAITGARDLILADQYSHACLKQGARLAGAEIIYFHHNHLADLEQKLEKLRSQYRRCLIITEAIFSMDGDRASLAEIVQLAENFEAMVLVDEAHSSGILGDRGSGLVEHLGLQQPLIQTGTLSKALGSQGGYVAGSQELIDFCRNRAASWIYTTALSPGDTAAAIAALELIEAEPGRRQQLWQNITLLKSLLAQAQIPCLPTDSAIFGLNFGEISTNLAIAQALNQAGFFAPAIRPPTVPTARIRVTLNSAHRADQIGQLVDVLAASIRR
ncbi:MAG: 8-amino-7-oxononanoate synthase [Pseudanabaenaceae cyanobacterium bins.68]|nr:8-amino-7-oxononanoate synthase [Pseudanabaenaceae cyanobacterium bins.68]